MKIITPNQLEFIKSVVPLSDLIFFDTSYNKVGRCPFCKSASGMHVHDLKGLFHCHECKKGGDLVMAYMELGNVTFTDACEQLYDYANIPVESYEEAEKSEVYKVLQRRADQFIF